MTRAHYEHDKEHIASCTFFLFLNTLPDVVPEDACETLQVHHMVSKHVSSDVLEANYRRPIGERVTNLLLANPKVKEAEYWTDERVAAFTWLLIKAFPKARAILIVPYAVHQHSFSSHPLTI